MTPFIETMPEQWVLDCIAAQGLALSSIQKFKLPEEMSEEFHLLAKAVLFQSWMMLKSGIISVDDIAKLVNHDCSDLKTETLDSVIVAVKEVLTRTYQIIEDIYQKEESEKHLISDVFQTKSEIH